MRSLVTVLSVAAIAVVASEPAVAQAAREIQVQAVGTFAPNRFLGGGVGVALRNRARTRIGLSLSMGDFSASPTDGGARVHTVGGRAEALLSYHVSPFERSGAAAYAGGGVAALVTEDGLSEYLLVVLGVETAPGGRRGWFVEIGLGGGVRASAGFRVRWR